MTLFAWLNDAVTKLLEFTNDGSRFVFGEYVDLKFSLALQVLPTIIFFSDLMSVLYHLGLVQRIVKVLALMMQKKKDEQDVVFGDVVVPPEAKKLRKQR